MAIDVEHLRAGLEQELAAAGTPDRAAYEKRYLKSDLTFLGASVPVIRAAIKRRRRQYPTLNRDDVLAVTTTLWSSAVHELRMGAVAWLDLSKSVLTPEDLPLLERLLRESRTWALVDALAIPVVGDLRERYPAEVEEDLEAWSHDPDFWIRRASLLAYLPGLRPGGGDFDAFARKADRMLAEREWFIRKAIGWVLRETAKRRPELVIGWLEPRAARASRLTVREATRHLPAADRDRILAVPRS